jgi:heat shock protein HslJ
MERKMKKTIIVVLLVIVFLSGCASKGNHPNFSDVIGTEWKLLEVHVDDTFGRNILFDRSVLSYEGFGEIFTLTFDTQLLSGAGSPNRYSAPFTLGEGNAITIMPMRSTLMASIFEQPERLPEHQYFIYMQGVYEWRLTEERLELLSKTEDGREVRLVFGL